MSNYVLEGRDLTKAFAGFVAVQRVNLGIKEGHIHALIGPNGAGKTTCFNLLTKFLSPSAGKILFRGVDITADSPTLVARNGIVRSFQISAVFLSLSPLDNIRVALQRAHGKYFQFWRSSRSLNELNERGMELLDRVGLAEVANRPAKELSYGRRRALELATTLALEPTVMLLDEPMAGLGLEDVQRVSDLIRKAAEGRTVVMVEHNLNVVADLSDRITVLCRGEVLTEGSYADVSTNPAVIEAYLGLPNE